MAYFAFAVFLLAVLFWYGEGVLPVIGISAIVALYFMAQQPPAQSAPQPRPQQLRYPI